jgi:hypothetical protein
VGAKTQKPKTPKNHIVSSLPEAFDKNLKGICCTIPYCPITKPS